MVNIRLTGDKTEIINFMRYLQSLPMLQTFSQSVPCPSRTKTYHRIYIDMEVKENAKKD